MCLPTATAAVQEQLDYCAVLDSSNANDGPVPLHEETFCSDWLILEKECYTSIATHSGSCYQKHCVSSELAIHMVQDRQDAAWALIQAGDTGRNAQSTRQQTNKHTKISPLANLK